MAMTYSEVASYGNKIKSFRRNGFEKSAAKLTKEFAAKVEEMGPTETPWITDIVFGIGHEVSELHEFING